MTSDVVLPKDGETIDPEKMYFPDMSPRVRPFGSRVLVQIRGVKSITDGGIIKVVGIFPLNDFDFRLLLLSLSFLGAVHVRPPE